MTTVHHVDVHPQRMHKQKMSTVNKENAIPYYLQLAVILREKISTGEYLPNELLPSERELCEAYDVSRSTVRQTMQTLKDESLIRKQRGIGTRVASSPKIEQNLTGFHDFDLQMQEQGHDASMVILGHEILRGSGRAQRLLKLKETESIFRLDRLRLVGGKPVFIEKIYLPLARFPHISDSDFAATDLFLKKVKNDYGITLGQVKVFLEPVLLYDAECASLSIQKKPAPGLLFERITHDDTGVPIAMTKRVFRGDSCRHILEIKTR